MQAEAGRNLERIYVKRIRDLCAADDRGWGSGVAGYDRVTFVNEQELPSKMLTLIREWKTTGSLRVRLGFLMVGYEFNFKLAQLCNSLGHQYSKEQRAMRDFRNPTRALQS
jgi:hypothetical protein